MPPTIERGSTYADIVGNDPTPWTDDIEAKETKWEKTYEREFFPISIKDFVKETGITECKGLLLPEGTASFARYAAKCIAQQAEIPEKIFYIMDCFRNEDVTKLTSEKRRAFGQIGVEYLSGKQESDAEVAAIACKIVNELGVDKKFITARVSNVEIFRGLCKETGMDNDEKVRMKTLIDRFSKLRLQDPYDSELQGIREMVWKISGRYRANWNKLLEKDTKASDFAGMQLEQMIENIERTGFKAVFDASMIRGWEYYTGPIFQIDAGDFLEIAGGGRYDRMVNQFLKKYGIERELPATGFAFGTERLVNVVKRYATIPNEYTVAFRRKK